MSNAAGDRSHAVVFRKQHASPTSSLPKIRNPATRSTTRARVAIGNLLHSFDAVLKEGSSRKDWENLLCVLKGGPWQTLDKRDNDIVERVKRVWLLLSQKTGIGSDTFIRVPLEQSLKSVFPEIISQCEERCLPLQISDVAVALPHVLRDVVTEARLWSSQKPAAFSHFVNFHVPPSIPQHLPPIPSPDVIIQKDDSVVQGKKALTKRIAKVTGRELVENLIQNKLESEFEMAYLVQASHPYDLIVVDKRQIRSTYYVISKLGVLFVTSHGIEDNLTLAEWYHHSLLFDILKKYAFFRLHPLIKAFAQWKANVKYSKFQRLYAQVKTNLICGYPPYGSAVLAIRDVLVNLDIPDVLTSSSSSQSYCFSTTEFDELIDAWSTDVRDALSRFFAFTRDVLIATGNRVYAHVDELELIQRNPPLSTSLPISVEKERKVELALSLKRAGGCLLRLGLFSQYVRRLIETRLIELLQSHLCVYLKRVGSTPLVEVQLVFSHADDIVSYPRRENVLRLVSMPVTAFVACASQISDSYDVTNLCGSAVDVAVDTGVVDTEYPGVLRSDAGKMIVKGRHVIGHVQPLYSSLEENVLSDGVVRKGLNRLSEAADADLDDVLEFGRTYPWLAELHSFVKSYSPELLTLYVEQPKGKLETFFDKLNSWQRNLRSLPAFVYAQNGLLQADCQPICGSVQQKLIAIVNDFNDSIIQRWFDSKSTLKANLDEISAVIRVVECSVIGDFIEYARQVQIANEQRPELQANLEKIIDQCTIIEQYELLENPSTEEVVEAWETFLFALQKGTDYVSEQTPVNSETLLSKLKELDDRCDDLRAKLDGPYFRTPTELIDPLMEQLLELGNECFEVKNESDSVSQSLVILTGNPWNQDKVNSLVLSYHNQHFLWKCYEEMKRSLKQWKSTPFSKINMHHVMTRVSEWLGPVLVDLSTKVPSNNEVFADWHQTLKEIGELLNPLEKISVSHLKSSHWIALCVGLGLGAEEQDSVTVGELLQCNLLKKSSLIDTICLEAATLHALQLSLRQVTAAWEHREFRLAKHVGVFDDEKRLPLSDAYLLIDVDEMNSNLEDDVIGLQLILSSPAASVELKVLAQTWLTMLEDLESLLDLWENTQNKWLYLRSLIEKVVVRKPLSHLHRKFAEIDNRFQKIVRHFVENPKVLSVIDQISTKFGGGASATSFPRLYQSLAACLAEEESLLAHVDDHIELLCEQFPRLYFISKDSIIQLSATNHNPKLIVPFVSLVYPNIRSVTVRERSAADAVTGQGQLLEIVDIIGDGGEVVSLREVVTTDKEPHLCLRELGRVSRQTLAFLLRQCLASYPKSLNKEAISEWVEAFPSQCLLRAAAIHFTRLVEGGIKFKKLRTYYHNLSNALYRCLRNHKNVVYENLVLQSLQHRDIAEGLLSSTLQWSSQCFRHFLDIGDGSYKIRLADDVFDYGYEYIGPLETILVNPLTDRHLHGLAQAVASYRCGSLHASKGTGKSALIQHIGEAFGRHSVTVLCSSFVNPSLLLRYFSGACRCGSWLAFVDCHALSNALLHLLSQCILQLTRAMQSTFAGAHEISSREMRRCASLSSLDKQSEKESFSDDMECPESRSIVFQSKLIPCLPDCAFFLATSQPVTKMPDYLHASLRIVTPSSPSLRQVCNVYLWLAGFEDAFTLSSQLSQFLSQISNLTASSPLRHAKLIASTARRLRDAETSRTDVEVLQRASILYTDPIVASDDKAALKRIAFEAFGSCENLEKELSDRRLFDEIREQYNRSKLTPTDAAVAKVSQLYRSLENNGVTMLCGAAGCGKTACYTILHQMLNRFYADYSQSAMIGKSETLPTTEVNRVEVSTIFPSSLSSSELFGGLLVESNQWRDGLLARLLRRLLRSCSSVQTNRWIILDGHLPSDLAETLIPAFSKRQSLCLSSGERLAIADSVHVLMEEVDVSPYSPACLSHAALVYFGSDTVGWRAVHQSWIDSCYSKWDAHLVRLLSSQCEHIIEPTLKFLDSRSSGALQHVTALSNFLASLLEKNQHQLRGSRFQLTNDHIVRLLSSLFGLAYIWAFGSCLDENDFASFDAFAREQLSLCPIPVTIPDEGTVFDYWIDVSSEGDCQFVAWPDRSTTKSSILSIPKVTRYVTLCDLLVTSGFDVLLSGPAGVGKTSLIELASARHSHSHATFFPAITGQQLRVRLTEKLHSIQKRQQVSIAGSGGNTSRCDHVIFVDDLNAVSASDATPFEVLRQAVSHRSVVDVHSLVPESLTGIQFVGACLNRNPLSDRLLRHFTVLSIPRHSDDTLRSLLAPSTSRWVGSLDDISNPVSFADALVEMSIRFYRSVRSALVPTPANPHHRFTYHHLMRLHQSLETLGGLLRRRDGVDQSLSRRRGLGGGGEPRASSKGRKFSGGGGGGSKIETMTQTVVRFYCHEVMRCYSDHLTSSSDATKVQQSLRQLLTEQLCGGSSLTTTRRRPSAARSAKSDSTGGGGGKFLDMREVIGIGQDLQQLVFTQHLLPSGATVIGYRECSLPQLIEGGGEVLRRMKSEELSLSSDNGGGGDVLMFREAAEHCARLCRVLMLPQGHAILVGNAVCGKATVVKLACVAARKKLIEIEPADGLTASLKEACHLAGLKGEECVLFVKAKRFAHCPQAVFMLMKRGAVSGLYSADEMRQMTSKLSSSLRSVGTRKNHAGMTVEKFWQNVKKKTHIVISMTSPDDVTRWIGRDPGLLGLVSTIDYHKSWPKEALTEVAYGYLQRLAGDEIPWNDRGGQALAISEFMAFIHLKACDSARSEWKRDMFTPYTYTEFIEMFISIGGELRKRYEDELSVVEGAVHKIGETNLIVERYQSELFHLNKNRDECANACRETENETETMKERLETLQRAYRDEEEIQTREKLAIDALRSEAQLQYDEVTPLYEAALSALNSLTKRDVDELKTYVRPPVDVREVACAVCLLFGLTESWDEAKMLFHTEDFFENLQFFDKERMSGRTLARLGAYTSSRSFADERIGSVSRAAASLAMWVKAVETFASVHKVVEPKRKKLAKAEGRLKQMQHRLIDIQKEMMAARKEWRIAAQKNAKSTKALAEIDETINGVHTEVEKAENVLTTLREEETNWTADQKRCRQELTLCPGNATIAAAFVTYLGCLSADSQNALLRQWIDFAKSHSAMKITMPFHTVSPYLSRSAELESWKSSLLPRDSFSTNTASALKYCLRYGSKRWPLIIDPHDQAELRLATLADEKSAFVAISADQKDVKDVLFEARVAGRNVLLTHIERLENFVDFEHVLKRSLGGADVCFATSLTKSRLSAFDFRLEDVCVLDMSLSGDGLQEWFLYQSAQIDCPEYVGHIRSVYRDIAIHSDNQRACKRHALDVVAHVEGDLLTNYGVVETAVCEGKEKQLLVQSQLEAADQLLQELVEKVNDHRPLARLMSCLVRAIETLEFVVPLYRLAFDWITRIFRRTMCQIVKLKVVGSDPKTHSQEVATKVTKSVFQCVTRSLLRRHAVVLALLLLLKERQVKKEMLELFVWDGAAADGRTASRKPGWLSEKEWNVVKKLEKDGQVLGLGDDLCVNADQWKEYFQLDPIFLAPEPLKSLRIDDVHKLILWKAISPQKFSEACVRFVADYFGPAFIEQNRSTLPDLVEMTMATRAALIIHEDIYTTKTVQQLVCTAKEIPECTGIYPLFLTHEMNVDSIVARLRRSRDDGHWIILNATYWKGEWPHLVVNALKEILSDLSLVHEHFRLWILGSIESFLPLTLHHQVLKISSSATECFEAETNTTVCLRDFEKALNYAKARALDMETSLKEHWTSREWKAWMSFLVIGFNLLYVTRATLPVTSVAIAKEFAWQKSTSGIVLSSFYWGYVCTQIPGGWLASRYGGELVLYYSALIWSVATFLLPITARMFGVFGVIVVRVVAGIAQGTFYPALAVLIAVRVSETSRTLSFCLPCAASMTGTLVCGFLASFLARYDWDLVFYVSGLIGLLWALTGKTCLMSAPSYRSSCIEANNNAASLSLKAFFNSSVAAVCVNHTCDCILLAVFFSWLPTYTHDLYPEKPVWPISTLPWLAVTISQISSAVLADRLIRSGMNVVRVRKLVQAVSNLGGAGALLFLGLGSPSFSVSLLLTTLALLAYGFHASGSFSFFIAMKPELAGTLTGLANTFGQLPGIFAVSAVGVVLESTGGNWSIVFLAISGLLVLGLICFLVVAKIPLEK